MKDKQAPWSVDEGWSRILDADGKLIILLGAAGRVDDLARIVACVNACAGIEDPAQTIKDLLAACQEVDTVLSRESVANMRPEKARLRNAMLSSVRDAIDNAEEKS